jgi:cytochrome P450
MSNEVASRTIKDVVTYAEAGEAWRCPAFSTNTAGPGEEFFHKDVIVRVDGPEHVLRRRTMGGLLKARGHQVIRDTILYPTARARMSQLLDEPDADGYARTNLVQWLERTNFQMAAAMVGFDEGREGDSAIELVELTEAMLRGRPSNLMVSTGKYSVDSDAQKRALAARQAIIDRFYTPALERRRDLVAKVEAGEASANELPNDLMTMLATDADPAWRDPALAEREALFLLNAGVHTTGTSIYWSLREIVQWLESHPKDRELLQDNGFLGGCTEESMRLHVVTGGFPRMAMEHVELSEGTIAEEGDMMIIRSGPANVDEKVFGADALEYNPRREMPEGVNGFAYAFGQGIHQCFGMPIVMGAKGIDGSLVFLLKALFAAKIEFDPDGPEQPTLESTRGHWTAVPPIFSVRFPVSVAP